MMALVATKVETVKEGNTNLTVKSDIVLDTETGLVLERKTVLAEVATESGQHVAVVAGQQTRVAAIRVLQILIVGLFLQNCACMLCLS